MNDLTPEQKAAQAEQQRLAAQAALRQAEEDAKKLKIVVLTVDEKTAPSIVDIWKQVIEVQEHFNELSMQVRNFALTLLVAVLGGTALAVKEEIVVPLGARSVSLASVVLLCGAGGWVGFYLLDRFWYHRLLVGSVEHGMRMEEAYAEKLPMALTRAITAASRVDFERGAKLFFGLLITLGLVVGIALTTIALIVPTLWPSPTVLLIIAAVALAVPIVAMIRAKWTIKARARLDVFYGLIFVILILLAWAANGALVPEGQRATSSRADWFGLPYRAGALRDQAAADNAMRFETLQACMAWGRSDRAAVGFECARQCRANAEQRTVICVDNVSLPPEPAPQPKPVASGAPTVKGSK